MMKNIVGSMVLLLVLILSPLRLEAETGKIEEKENRLKTVAGLEKIRVLNELSSLYMIKSHQKVLDYARQVLELVKKFPDVKEEGIALYNIGVVNQRAGNYRTAIQYLDRALKLYKKAGFTRGLGGVQNSLGIIYMETGDYENALKYLLEALKFAEAIGFKRGMAQTMNNIGAVYADLLNDDKALEYYLRSLKIKEEIGDHSGIAYALGNIGIVYKNLKKYDEAMKYYRRAFVLHEKTGNKRGAAISLNNIANIQLALKQYDQALQTNRQALAIRREIGDKFGAVSSLNNIGGIYMEQGNFKQADKYLNEALGLSIEIGELDTREDIYKNLSAVAEARADYRNALKHYKKYATTRDEIFKKESREKIAEMQARYESEKKQQEIAILEKDNELLKKNNELLKKNSRIRELKLGQERFKVKAFIFGLILVLIILVLLFKRYLYFVSFWKKRNYVGGYRLIQKIGSGGMAVVFKAIDRVNRSRPVAVKIMKEEIAADQQQRERFMQEAALINMIEHKNIVKIIDRGEFQDSLFIVMELLEGETLARRIQQGVNFSLADSLTIVSQLADALAAIHQQGIIHRDLKPENIMLLEGDENEWVVKLLDFGLAKARDLNSFTESGMVMGTINYLPPEQLFHGQFSFLSDVYALGIIFYELITLQKPFNGSTTVEIMQEILNREPEPPRYLRKDVTAEINDLIVSMIDKNPEKRPDLATVRERVHRLSEAGQLHSKEIK